MARGGGDGEEKREGGGRKEAKGEGAHLGYRRSSIPLRLLSNRIFPRFNRHLFLSLPFLSVLSFPVYCRPSAQKLADKKKPPRKIK